MSPRIQLTVMYPDGRVVEAESVADQVTADKLAAADDLFETMWTGERPLIIGLYDLCARAFGTTREDAKERLHGAAYGKQGAPLP